MGCNPANGASGAQAPCLDQGHEKVWFVGPKVRRSSRRPILDETQGWLQQLLMASRTMERANMNINLMSSWRPVHTARSPEGRKSTRARRARFHLQTEALEDRRLLAGFFQAPVPTTLASADPSHIQVADFNRDGRPDVAVLTSTKIEVLLGQAGGTFSSTASLAPTAGFTFRSIAVGDLNRDGLTDITAISTNAVSFQAQTFLNSGGTFALPSAAT